jgi:hypothetical protein
MAQIRWDISLEGQKMTDKPEPQNVRVRTIASAIAHVDGLDLQNAVSSDREIYEMKARAVLAALARSDAEPTQDVRTAYPDRDYRHGSDLVAALRKGYPITNLRLSVADEIERALAKSPEQQNVQVTDAMVDRAVTAYFGEHDEIFSLGGAHEAATRDMQRALTAALARSDAQPVAHGEAIPDCPTEGIAARQGNGG